MNITLSKKVRTEEKINVDIEFPVYYIHDLMLDNSDVVYYGKIEENRCVTIEKSEDYQDCKLTFGLEINKFKDLSDAGYDEYILYDKYKSNKEQFEKILQEAKEHLNKF